MESIIKKEMYVTPDGKAYNTESEAWLHYKSMLIYDILGKESLSNYSRDDLRIISETITKHSEEFINILTSKASDPCGETIDIKVEDAYTEEQYVPNDSSVNYYVVASFKEACDEGKDFILQKGMRIPKVGDLIEVEVDNSRAYSSGRRVARVFAIYSSINPLKSFDNLGLVLNTEQGLEEA